MKNVMEKTDRKELAEAIITVLRTAYKKEARDAFKLVEAAGYDVYKSDGHWYVRNTDTWKTVSIQQYRYSKYGDMNTLSLSGYGVADARKVDLIAYLEKPFNPFKYERLYEPSRHKIEELRTLKWWLERQDNEVKELEKKLARAHEEYTRRVKDIAIFRAKNVLV